MLIILTKFVKRNLCKIERKNIILEDVGLHSNKMLEGLQSIQKQIIKLY